MSRSRQPSRLLADFAQRVPHARGVLLLSADGLKKAAYGPDDDDADQLAACAFGLYVLACDSGRQLADGAPMRQAMVELDTVLLSVTTAGSGGLLAVLADAQVDAAVLGHEMAALASDIRSRLAAPVPDPAAR